MEPARISTRRGVAPLHPGFEKVDASQADTSSAQRATMHASRERRGQTIPNQAEASAALRATVVSTHRGGSTSLARPVHVAPRLFGRYTVIQLEAALDERREKLGERHGKVAVTMSRLAPTASAESSSARGRCSPRRWRSARSATEPSTCA